MTRSVKQTRLFPDGECSPNRPVFKPDGRIANKLVQEVGPAGKRLLLLCNCVLKKSKVVFDCVLCEYSLCRPTHTTPNA